MISGAVAGQPSEYDRVVARIAPLLTDLKPPDVSQLEPADWLSDRRDWRRGVTAPQPAECGRAVTRRGGRGDRCPGCRLLRTDQGSHACHLGRVALAVGGDNRNGDRPSCRRRIVPAGLRDQADSIAHEISAFSAGQALGSPTGEVTGLGELLTAAGLAAEHQQMLIAVMAGRTGTPEQFWQQLSAEPGFQDAGTVARLQLTAQLGLLTGNHLPLIRAVLADTAITSTADLVGLDTDAWNALVGQQIGGQPADRPLAFRLPPTSPESSRPSRPPCPTRPSRTWSVPIPDGSPTRTSARRSARSSPTVPPTSISAARASPTTPAPIPPLSAISPAPRWPRRCRSCSACSARTRSA